MKRRKYVIISSEFPASKRLVFSKLQELSTLQKITYPLATFESMDNCIKLEVNGDYKFRLKLFGFIPFAIHRIHVVKFSQKDGIYTNEKNEHIPVWNHEIILKEIDENTCLYTDKVEIGAGWKTSFIYFWAKIFYRHRQRKWIKYFQIINYYF